MNKMETQKLTNLIKGYYNSQFFIDEYVIEAWYNALKPYEFNDAVEHLQKYLKDFPETPPKPHVFKNGLYTPEEKEKRKNSKYTVQCNLCHRWMSIEEYDSHYSRCLSINYLVNKAKKIGEDITREDLENCREDVLNRLYEKYKPQKSQFKPQKL